MGAASSPDAAAGPALTRPDAASAASRLCSCERATRVRVRHISNARIEPRGGHRYHAHHTDLPDVSWPTPAYLQSLTFASAICGLHVLHLRIVLSRNAAACRAPAVRSLGTRHGVCLPLARGTTPPPLSPPQAEPCGCLELLPVHLHRAHTDSALQPEVSRVSHKHTDHRLPTGANSAAMCRQNHAAGQLGCAIMSLSGRCQAPRTVCGHVRTSASDDCLRLLRCWVQLQPSV